jgi:hypothetical protein
MVEARQVMRLVADVLGSEPLGATHMDFGHMSVTYEVALPDRQVMVRTNERAEVFAGTAQPDAPGGSVDFDVVCYGDSLYMVGLTATAIVSDVGTRELFYVEELCRCWSLTDVQRRVVAFYAASFALDFVRRFHAAESKEWNARMLQAIEQWVATATRRA